jgi:hypothetical protein
VLPEQREDAIKDDLTKADVRFSSWSPLFRVDVVDLRVGVYDANEDVRFLYHDGLLGSAIYRYDGNPKSLTRFRHRPPQAPVRRDRQEARTSDDHRCRGGNEILDVSCTPTPGTSTLGSS